MKKQITIILISSVIAMVLCGCTQQNETTPDKNSSAGSSVSAASENAEEKEDDKDKEEEKASAQVSVDSDGVVYNDEGEVLSTPSKYISTTQMEFDISDAEMAKANEELKISFFTSKKELDDFYSSNKDKYALDKPDNGSDFKTVTKDLTDDYFTIYNVMVVVQSYDKEKGIEIGDTYKNDNGVVLDIYRDEPASADKAAYTMSIICYSKDEVSKVPEINFLPAGTMYADESDPDVIVSVVGGADDE